MNQGNIEKLLIYGCGGHAKSVADVALTNGIKEIIFIDNKDHPNETLFGFDLVNENEINLSLDHFRSIIGIGDNVLRSKLFAKHANNIVALVSNDAHIGVNAKIAAGVFVGNGAYIGPNTSVDENTIINTHCVIEHDCKLGKHSHISVNATVAGSCTIGDFVMIGAGATIIDDISICSNVVVGAGSVVIRNIVEPGTYIGAPVRKIK